MPRLFAILSIVVLLLTACSGGRSDRSAGEPSDATIPVVVDWIYPTLTAKEKATIREVFLCWSEEIITAGYHHPEPVGLTNDPQLLADSQQVRFAGNNYFAAHMRNLGLMALALDEGDDPGGALRAYLDIATGAYLYIFNPAWYGDSQDYRLPNFINAFGALGHVLTDPAQLDAIRWSSIHTAPGGDAEAASGR